MYADHGQQQQAAFLASLTCLILLVGKTLMLEFISRKEFSSWIFGAKYFKCLYINRYISKNDGTNIKHDDIDIIRFLTK